MSDMPIGEYLKLRGPMYSKYARNLQCEFSSMAARIKQLSQSSGGAA